MSEESWKAIPGYEGLYEASDLGKVKSLDREVRGKRGPQRIKGKVLKPWKDTRGYPQVYLCLEGKRKPVSVHRIVMLTFVGEGGLKNTVNHINGQLDDNRLVNLEWCTQKENNRKAFDTGLMDTLLGENNTTSGLTNKQALEIRKLYSEGKKSKEISEMYQVKRYHICNIVHNKSFKRVIPLKLTLEEKIKFL